MALGVKPNVALAREAGIALGPTGAITVDNRQHTNLPNIWAAGDVAEAHHRVTGRPAYIPLGTTANKQGRVTGTNVAGGDVTFAGIVGTAAAKVFDRHVASTGLSEQRARRRLRGGNGQCDSVGARSLYAETSANPCQADIRAGSATLARGANGRAGRCCQAD